MCAASTQRTCAAQSHEPAVYVGFGATRHLFESTSTFRPTTLLNIFKDPTSAWQTCAAQSYESAPDIILGAFGALMVPIMYFLSNNACLSNPGPVFALPSLLTAVSENSAMDKTRVL